MDSMKEGGEDEACRWRVVKWGRKAEKEEDGGGRGGKVGRSNARQQWRIMVMKSSSSSSRRSIRADDDDDDDEGVSYANECSLIDETSTTNSEGRIYHVPKRTGLKRDHQLLLKQISMYDQTSNVRYIVVLMVLAYEYTRGSYIYMYAIGYEGGSYQRGRHML
jgi:hypothetical protein